MPMLNEKAKTNPCVIISFGQSTYALALRLVFIACSDGEPSQPVMRADCTSYRLIACSVDFVRWLHEIAAIRVGHQSLESPHQSRSWAPAERISSHFSTLQFHCSALEVVLELFPPRVLPVSLCGASLSALSVKSPYPPRLQHP